MRPNDLPPCKVVYHIAFDTLGYLPALIVTPADAQDRVQIGACRGRAGGDLRIGRVGLRRSRLHGLCETSLVATGICLHQGHFSLSSTGAVTFDLTLLRRFILHYFELLAYYPALCSTKDRQT